MNELSSYTPTPRLSHYQVGQSVKLKGASAIGDALVICAIQDDGYFQLFKTTEMHKKGRTPFCVSAGSHEVAA